MKGSFHGSHPKPAGLQSTPLWISWAQGKAHEAVIRCERMTALCSNFGPFSQEQSDFDVYTEIPHGVLDLRVSEQNLDGTQVGAPCAKICNGEFSECSAKRQSVPHLNMVLADTAQFP